MQWTQLLALSLAACAYASPVESPSSEEPTDSTDQSELSANFINSPPVVNLGYAIYKGSNDPTTGWNTFFNVKYAAPPTGNLRWRKPTSPTITFPRITDATTQDVTRCPQGIIPGVQPFEAIQAIPVSEDCLDLTIYTPSNATLRSGLPVVVHFHGGGYAQGSRADLHPQAWLDLTSRDVISVAVNFRIGAFGFLSSEDVKNDGDLNAGFWDQQYALEWVQKYIKTFGGDPSKVTLWGSSAGAGSIMHHVLTPSRRKNGSQKPLFTSGIANSPFNPPLYPYNHSIPTDLYNALATEVGCDTAANKLSCLRGKPLIPDLRDANIRVAERGAYGTFSWYPVIDGSFVSKGPAAGLGAGKAHNGQKLIVTHQVRDGFLFTPSGIQTEAEATAFLHELIPTISDATLASLEALYTPAAGFPDPALKLEGMIKDYLFHCLTQQMADTFSTGSNAAYKGQWQLSPGFHVDDVVYYYNAEPEKLASRSTFENWTGSFAKFIKTGNPDADVNPNPATNVKWKKWQGYSAGKAWEKTFEVDANQVSQTAMQKVDAATWQRCQAWKAAAEETFQ